MNKLDKKYRTIVTLRLVDGLTTRETSNHLKLPEGTVLSRLARAQEKLRNIIESIS